jgi:hypothetical protein
MNTPRLDLYGPIHKAIRLFMSRTLCQLGSTDALDAVQLRASLAQLHALLGFCAQHLKHEEAFIHPALQAVAGGAAARVCADHEAHRREIAELGEAAAQLPGLPAAERPAALAALYRAVAVFVGENFAHMEAEEREHNAMLWAHYSDAELHALHERLLASIEPATMELGLSWMLPALSAGERAGMLGGMQAGMPAPAFEGVLAIARRTLDDAAHGQLLRSLGRPVAPGLMAA